MGVVLGNYRITGELSRGGMGAVFTARHELLGRPAAVKLLRPELSANDELVERFFNEAKAATAIRHPGIVEVFDFGYTDDGRAYLIMELLDGKPLSKALADVERFTELEAATIARGIASALKAAHSQGIIHRDLKPDNVFLIPDLDGPTGGVRAKVLDFGIAKLSDSGLSSRHTQTGVLMGTPMYMAPEQARAASAIDHRADLYSLGCILYELLVGKPPFVAEGAGEIIAMQMFTDPQPPRERVPDLSVEMEQIVMRLLAKEPRDRFQTAGEVVSVLGAVGARMSAELVAVIDRPGSRAAASLRSGSQVAGRVSSPPSQATPVPQPTGRNPMLLDHVPEHAAPAKRSAMPIIAGVLTLAIATGVIALVATRGDGDAAAKPEPAPVQQPVAAPSPPAAPPAPPPAPSAAEDKREIIVVENKPAPVVRKPDAGSGSGKKPAVKKPPGPTTEKGAPYELDIGPDTKKKAH